MDRVRFQCMDSMKLASLAPGERLFSTQYLVLLFETSCASYKVNLACLLTFLPFMLCFYLFVTIDTSYPSCLQLLPSSCFPAHVGGTAEINPFTSDAMQISTLTSLFKYFFRCYYERQIGFSYFEFKIRLIRLRPSFKKNKNPYIWTHNLLILSQES